MMRLLATLPIPLVLLVAALLEAGGDALIRKSLVSGAGPARIALFAAGAAVLCAYGTLLNLAPIEFGRVVGLYIVFFFLTWQVIAWFTFGAQPTWPVLAGGALIVAGGLRVSFGKAA